MGPIHMTPEQAIEAQAILRAGTAIATHFGTFALADDSMEDPPQRLEKAIQSSNPQTYILLLAEGEPCEIPHVHYA